VPGVLALPALLMALAPYHSTVAPLPQPVQTQLKAEGFWRQSCPVALSGLRLLTVSHWGFDGRQYSGQLVVNRAAARPLARAFGQLYGLRFPIRHMQLNDMYGPKRDRPRDNDVTGAFDCRQAVPSPCAGGSGAGTWSMHAYGLAVDVNPRENPYVGCGQSRDPAAKPYFDRSHHRRGMVTPRAIAAFTSTGWGWGGAWAGNTKDYMHFSSNGH
jgi:D-alanyl-D-alanine carboxypeptidase